MPHPPILDLENCASALADATDRARAGRPLDDLADSGIQLEAVHRLNQLVPGATTTLNQIPTALAQHGLLLLRNVPAADDTLLILLGAVAAPATTCEANGPRLVDHLSPAVSGEERHRAQNQRSEMLLHTDASAQQAPPDIVGLACVANEGNGGGSVLVAVDDIVKRMCQDGQKRTIGLLQNDFPYIHPQRTERPATLAPVLRDLGDGHFHVRYRKENLETGKALCPDALTEDTWAAAKLFARYLEADSRPQTTLRLQRGDYLLFDNRRYLHGRAAIDPAAYRLLKRTYFTHPTKVQEPVR
ncbi:TauD/TfdA family dioxygenase [Streptomyces sp. NPDC001508]|uniref:TauD/TfdA family dioxygenase n=1 Tax=Streptomyces sp. NPDC001508 TaxID=3154656 RepID=UPI00332E2951